MQAGYHILCVGQVSAAGVVIYAIVLIRPPQGFVFRKPPARIEAAMVAPVDEDSSCTYL